MKIYTVLVDDKYLGTFVSEHHAHSCFSFWGQVFPNSNLRVIEYNLTSYFPQYTKQNNKLYLISKKNWSVALLATPEDYLNENLVDDGVSFFSQNKDYVWAEDLHSAVKKFKEVYPEAWSNENMVIFA